MKYNIGLLKGDGIGPEIVDSAVRVLEKIGKKYGHVFEFTPYLIGGAAIDACGKPLPEETVEGCMKSDSVLLGAVGGPKWDTLPGNMRPEKALLGIRSAMGLFTNLRPAKLYPALKDECPLRADIVENGFDVMIVRELTGGIYFGERGYREGKYGTEAYDTESYSKMEIERIARVAYGTAAKRRGKLVSITESNVFCNGSEYVISLILSTAGDGQQQGYCQKNISHYSVHDYCRGLLIRGQIYYKFHTAQDSGIKCADLS